MRTVELPRATWTRRLDEFTRLHEGRLISIDIIGPDIGAQPLGSKIPLIGISADRIDHDGSVAVSVERAAGGHLTHIIEAVNHIYIERTDDDIDAAIAIDSAGGVRTILRLVPSDSDS